MNRYPLWKNLLVIVITALGLFYALPNLYGEDPSVQIGSKAGTLTTDNQQQVEQARLHAERYWITEENAPKIRAARRVVAVGTTAVRTVESAWRDGVMSGETDIFIYPGVAFRRVGALLTNFHLPGTSLLLLVCAFAGKELAMEAYRHAVEFRYRFYSYGDCMLIV